MEDVRLLQGAPADVAAASDLRGKCSNGLLPPQRSRTPRDRTVSQSSSPCCACKAPSLGSSVVGAVQQRQTAKTPLASLNHSSYRVTQLSATCGGRGSRCHSWSQMRSSSTETYPYRAPPPPPPPPPTQLLLLQQQQPPPLPWHDERADCPTRSTACTRSRGGSCDASDRSGEPGFAAAAAAVTTAVALVGGGRGGCGSHSLDAQTQTEPASFRHLLDERGAATLGEAHSGTFGKYESTISDIGVEYMRQNGGLGRFRQLQRPDATPTQSADLASSCRTLNCAPHLEDVRTAVVTVCSAAAAAAAGDTRQQTPQPASHGKFASGDIPIVAPVGVDGRSLAPPPLPAVQQEQQQPQYVGYRLGRRKMLGEKRKRIADYCLAFAMFGLALMIAETELCNVARVYRKEESYSYVLKSLIGASTVVLLVFIGIYHAVDLQLYLIDNCIDDWRIAMTWPRIVQIAAELTVCAVHPIPGAYYFKWAIYDRSSATWHVSDVPVDIVFSLPMFARLYLVVRALMLHSKLFTDASSRSIGALNKISFNTRFVLKTLMTMCPGTVLVVFLVTLWLVAAWTLRCCEHHHDIVFANYLNALYMVAITFLSVGYGDIVPLTYCGRGIAVCSGLMGAGCTALVVAVVANKLQLTRAEKHVHNFMMDTQLTKKLKDAAANVLRETWLIYKHTRLVKRINASRVRTHQQKFLAAIHELRKVKVLQRKLNDEASSMVDLAKTQAQVHELVAEMKQQHMVMENHVALIENALRSLQLQVEAIPSAVGQIFKEKQRSSSFISALEVNTTSYDSPGHREPFNRLHRQTSLDSSNC